MKDQARQVLAHYKDELRAMQDAIDVISGKWTMQILALLCHDTLRFSEIQRLLPEISPRMLSMELKQLQQHDLVDSTVADVHSTRQLYRMSAYGYSMVPLIGELSRWGAGHREHMRGKQPMLNNGSDTRH